jgi:hypothetical protein
VNNTKAILGTAWRSVVVAIGYFVGLMAAGMLGGLLGWRVPSGSNTDNQTSMVVILVSTILLGVFLGPVAARLKLSRIHHFFLWLSLIIFNLGSVALEGAYFAPNLVKIPVPVLLVQQLFAAAGASLAITFLFARPGFSLSWLDSLGVRPWHSWLWRFLVSAFSYLVFYWVFGGINYALVTKPYYATHAGGLTVPAPETVLVLESVRGLLIVFSVLLLLLSMRGTRRQLVATTGWLVFAVGGIIPLCWQITTLPLFLLFASAIEIFFQNFLTGAVSASLLGITEQQPPLGTDRNGETLNLEKRVTP